MNRIRTHLVAIPALVAAFGGAAAAPPPRPPTIEALHARAVESFRQGRFSEAYGLFIEMADAGHRASARYALFMCEHGLELFGKDWDCAPQDVLDWADTAGVAAPVIVARSYPKPAASRSGSEPKRH